MPRISRRFTRQDDLLAQASRLAAKIVQRASGKEASWFLGSLLGTSRADLAA